MARRPQVRRSSVGTLARNRLPGVQMTSQNNLPQLIGAYQSILRETARAGASAVRQRIADRFEEEGPGWQPNEPSTIRRKGHDSILVGREHGGRHNRDAVTTERLTSTPTEATFGTGWGDEPHPDGRGDSRGTIQWRHEVGAGVPQRPILFPIVASDGPFVARKMSTAYYQGVRLTLARRLHQPRPLGERLLLGGGPSATLSRGASSTEAQAFRAFRRMVR